MIYEVNMLKFKRMGEIGDTLFSMPTTTLHTHHFAHKMTKLTAGYNFLLFPDTLNVDAPSAVIY